MKIKNEMLKKQTLSVRTIQMDNGEQKRKARILGQMGKKKRGHLKQETHSGKAMATRRGTLQTWRCGDSEKIKKMMENNT